MSTEGWILLHRQIFDNPLWQEKPFSRGQAWVDLLLLANHEAVTIKKRGIDITIERGEVGWGQRKLAERWGWSRGKVERFFEELKTSQQMSLRTGPENNNVSSRICITNYDLYQMDGAGDRAAKQDRKQGQEQRMIKKEPITSSPRERREKTPHEAIVSAYDRLCPTLPRLRGIGEDRKRAIKARWEEYQDLAIFEEMFRKTEASDFLSGRDGRWTASFDWLMKPANMRKVLEGNYDNKGGNRPCSNQQMLGL